MGQFAPPSSPSGGDAYLIGGTPTGAWSGYAYKIASCIDGAWRFYTPFNGLRAYVATTGAFIVYVGGAWTDWNSLISSNEVSVASASTCDLGAAGSLFVQITGTTAITSFGAGANKLRFVRFADALTLTYNATSLILLGGVSRTTAAGDTGVYASDASGNWTERGYFRAANGPDKLGATTLPNGGALNSDGSGALVSATFPVLKIARDAGSANTNIYSAARCEAKTTATAVSNGFGTGILFGANYNGTWTEYGRFTTQRSGADNSGAFVISTNNSGASGQRLVIDPVGNVGPGADNTQNFGSATLRWATIYAGTGTINTSGEATKTNVRALSEAELAAAKALAANARIFQFCDAVAKKGVDAARLHAGLIYEDVVAAFAAHGLDAERYGIICRDRDDADPQKWILGLRYSELAQFVMAGLAARLAALEAR